MMTGARSSVAYERLSIPRYAKLPLWSSSVIEENGVRLTTPKNPSSPTVPKLVAKPSIVIRERSVKPAI
ncbi:MAG: hypothetical protein ACJAYU_001432 [Bradymonadia bacterium]|jgi:hypothetical protein